MAAGALQPVEVEDIGIDVEATILIGRAQPVIIDHRGDDRLGGIVGALAQTLEAKGIDAEEAALVEALAIGPAGQEVLGAAEMEPAEIGLVRRTVELITGTPILIEIPGAGTERMAAQQR